MSPYEDGHPDRHRPAGDRSRGLVRLRVRDCTSTASVRARTRHRSPCQSVAEDLQKLRISKLRLTASHVYGVEEGMRAMMPAGKTNERMHGQ